MLQPEVETLDREALARLQLDGMRRTLARVRANPAWVRRLDGAEAGDVRSVDDWRRLPFLTKTELRDAYPYTLACGDAADYRRVHMSSGTTGNPILNPYTAADVAQWGEVMARCLAVAGVTRADVVQITPSFGLFTGGFGFHYGAERLGAMIVPVGAGRTLLQLTLMRDLGVTVLPAIATYPLRLIEVARQEGFDLASLRLRVAEYRPRPAAWPPGLPLTIAAISDLHAGEPHVSLGRVEAVVAAANALRPDLIVLLGDYAASHRFVTRAVPPAALARALGALSAPLGVHAILGNHDWWDDAEAMARRGGPTLWTRALEAAGIPVLANDATRLRHRGRPIWLLGLDSLWAFRRGADGYRVADVGSLNGTYVNRDRIDEVLLQGGDEVQIGKYRLVYFASHSGAGSPQ